MPWPSRRATVQDLSVLPDDEGGGFLAVHHLVKMGRSSIADISGPGNTLRLLGAAPSWTGPLRGHGRRRGRPGRGRSVVWGVERSLGQTGRRRLVGARTCRTPFFAAATKSRAVLRMSCANVVALNSRRRGPRRFRQLERNGGGVLVRRLPPLTRTWPKTGVSNPASCGLPLRAIHRAAVAPVAGNLAVRQLTAGVAHDLTGLSTVPDEEKGYCG